MGVMPLSTLARVRRAANKTGANDTDDALLRSALASASQAMQMYCSMEWQRGIQTDTRACNPNGILMLRSKPVWSIQYVQYLRQGTLQPQTLLPSQYALFDGNELRYPGGGPLERLIVTYEGGVASSADVSTEAITSHTGTPVVGDTFASDLALGSIVSVDLVAGTAQLRIADGTFLAGDVLTSTTQGHTWTLTLGETVAPSIVSDYADLANACDQQALYIYQRRSTPGRKVVQSGNAPTTFEDGYKLLPGVVEVLEFYDHQFLG